MLGGKTHRINRDRQHRRGAWSRPYNCFHNTLLEDPPTSPFSYWVRSRAPEVDLHVEITWAVLRTIFQHIPSQTLLIHQACKTLSLQYAESSVFPISQPYDDSRIAPVQTPPASFSHLLAAQSKWFHSRHCSTLVRAQPPGHIPVFEMSRQWKKLYANIRYYAITQHPFSHIKWIVK